MSTYKILDTYFKAKDFQSHYDDVKSVHDYSKQVEKKSKDKSYWDKFKWPNKYSKAIEKAKKAANDAANMYKKVRNQSVDWPLDKRMTAYEHWAKMAKANGSDSAKAKDAWQNFAIVMANYQSALQHLLSTTEARLVNINKHLKIAQACWEYSNFLTKVFEGFAKAPSGVPGTVSQSEWAGLSISVTQYHGPVDTCVNILKELKKSHDATIPTLKNHIKVQNEWLIACFKDSSKTPDTTKYMKKAKSLKK